MTTNLEIENGFAAGLSIINAQARFNDPEQVSTFGWPGASPDRILQRDQPTTVTVSFTVSGLVQSLFAGCSWRVNLLPEQKGINEFALPAGATSEQFRTITVGEATPVAVTYNVTFNIPGQTFPEGLYDLVCMIRLVNPSNIPLPVAMFGEFANIEVYRA